MAERALTTFYAAIGELVLMANALDAQLNHIVIALLDLGEAKMLESVVASLDISRKIELLKARIRLLSASDWRASLTKHVDAVEKVSKMRNTAAHSVLSFAGADREPILTGIATTKLLKSIDLKTKTARPAATLADLKVTIEIGERALGSGQVALENLARLNAEKRKRTAIGDLRG